MNEQRAGEHGTPETSPDSVLRAVVDAALVESGLPDAIEPAPGGTVARRELSDRVASGLARLHAATGRRVTVDAWLAEVLNVAVDQLAWTGPSALAQMIRETAMDPTIEFGVPPMTDEEERQDIADSVRSSIEFGTIPHDLPKVPAR